MLTPRTLPPDYPPPPDDFVYIGQQRLQHRACSTKVVHRYSDLGLPSPVKSKDLLALISIKVGWAVSCGCSLHSMRAIRKDSLLATMNGLVCPDAQPAHAPSTHEF